MARTKAGNGVLKGLLLILLIVLAVGAISKLTNGFSERVKTFALKTGDGLRIYNDVYGMNLYGTQSYTIERVTGSAGDYEVKVYAYGTEETDFTFKKENEDGYSWYKNVVSVKGGTDFTEFFNVEKDGDTFRIVCAPFPDLIDAWSPSVKVTLPEVIPPGDRFILQVTCGSSTIRIGFYSYISAIGIGIDRNQIVF